MRLGWQLTRALSLLLILAPLLAGCAGPGGPMPGAPAHHLERGFRNTNPAFERPTFWERWPWVTARMWRATFSPRTADFPVASNDGRTLRENPGRATITWVGHSTLLVQFDGVNVLTDPHWSDRASPLAFGGPRRLTPPGLRFEDLPPIHLVLISHDHYDLDWWESRTVRGLVLTCLPAQHFSQRTLADYNRRLWAGWAIAGAERRLFFSGDTGYYDVFREIGRRLGPFDVAAVSIGAYLPPTIMRLTHTTPEEAFRIFEDVGGRHLVPVHWGTFDLADEPLHEPPRRLEAEARRLGLGPERVWLLRHGETRAW